MTSFLTLSWLDEVLWIGGFVVETALVLILLFRKQLKGLPVFMPFIAYGSAKTVVLFLISRFGTKHEYFWVFYIGSFGSDPIEYWLLAQIVRDALRPLKVWGRSIERSLQFWGGVILVTAALLAVGVGGPPGAKALDLWQIRASLFSDTIICCMLAVVSLTVVSHGSLSRPHVVAITRGLIVWSFSGLVSTFVQSIVGWNNDTHILNYVQESLYVTVEVYWIFVFWSPEKQNPPLSPEVIAYMEALHNQVQLNLQDLGDRPR